MKKLYISTVLTLCLIGGIFQKANAQLDVQDGFTAQQLVNELVGTNVATLNPVLNCPAGHSGTFHVVSSNLPIGDGIVLCTGDAKTDPLTGAIGVNGPWTFDIGQSNGGPSDPDLDSLGTPPFSNSDACILEFDFVPDIDTISTVRFNYSFGSEEYNEYACSSFNDVFAFFLTGPGVGTNVNVALVPGTNIPVRINSINDGPGLYGMLSNCTSMGPGSPFSAYYINNEAANGQTVSFEGFTTKLEASAQVHPCDTYHIKMTVQDVGDPTHNSGVFLEANSFKVDGVNLDFADIIKSDSGYIAEGCGTSKMTVTRDTTSNLVKKICFGYSGTATMGTDYNTMPDSLLLPPGQAVTYVPIIPVQDNIAEKPYETIIISRLNCCTKTPIDSVEIRIYDSLKITLHNIDTVLCKGDTLALHVSGDPDFHYSWKPTANIANPLDTLTYVVPQVTTNFTIMASFLSCPDVTKSFNLLVDPVPQVTISPHDTDLCLADPFQLRVDVQPASFTNFNYFWAPHTGIDNPYAKSPFFFYNDAGTFKYVLTVQSPIGCTNSDTVTITTRPGVDLKNVTPDQVVKYGSSVQLNSSGAEFYVWLPDKYLDYPNTADPIATPLEPTKLSLIGFNHWGCKDTAYVNLDIDYSMLETIPSAFSPNGDGHNDVFKVGSMKYQRLLEFRVFNRWGQEVFSTTDPEKGWDGTFKGQMQEVGVYNYIIRVATPDGKTRFYKGDVTLIQ